MDYFKQRREYRSFKLIEYHISNGQNNLYRELLDYANDENHLDHWFPMRNSALVNLTGLSESGLVKARNGLIVANLIEYRPGNKKTKKAPQYKIVCLYSDKKKVQQTENKKYSKQSGTSTVNGVELVQQTRQHKELTKTRHRLDYASSEKNEIKKDAGGAVSYWLNQVNPAESQKITQDIAYWVQDFGGQDEIVILAIDEMLSNGARNYNYLNKVLKSWESSKLDTPEKVRNHLKGYYEKANRPQKKEPTLPVFDEEYLRKEAEKYGVEWEE